MQQVVCKSAIITACHLAKAKSHIESHLHETALIVMISTYHLVQAELGFVLYSLADNVARNLRTAHAQYNKVTAMPNF